MLVVCAQHITQNLSDLVTFSFTLIFLQSSESREISPPKKLVTSWGVNREGDISELYTQSFVGDWISGLTSYSSDAEMDGNWFLNDYEILQMD